VKLYLFDFDGTISSKDSMVRFFLFIYPRHTFFLKCLSCLPFLFLYYFSITNKDVIKSKILKIFLAKFSLDELHEFAVSFSNFFDPYIKEQAKSYINNLLLSDSNKVYIVTASLDLWMEPIAKKLNVNLISTQALFKNNIFEGIEGRNCIGIEKVNRIHKKINLNHYDCIYAFGDTDGDKEMLKLANYPHFRYF
jgi:HAD superfamily phosphoserine phosphatase-like hydrolase